MDAPNRLARAIHRARHNVVRKWKGISAASAVGLFVVAAYMSYSSFEPRITDAYAAQRLEDTDIKLQKLEMDALNSEELSATTIDYSKRTITPQYLAKLNGLAVKLLLIRAMLISNANQSFRQDVFYDIGGLVKALNGCGSMQYSDVRKALEDYRRGYDHVMKASISIGDVLTGTHDLLRIHPSNRIKDSENLMRLLMSTMKDPHMLAHNSGKPRFDDVDELDKAMWELYRVHQSLVTSYHEKEKLNSIVKELSHQQ